MMHPTRRQILAAAPAGVLAPRLLSAGGDKKKRIRIGQIGTKHPHASGKMATLRKLSDHFEVVGVVEPDPDRRRALEGHDAYRGLSWLTEDQLLETKGLDAVAVETDVPDLVPTARRCVAADVHVHLDKPGGTSHSAYADVLTAAKKRGRIVQMGYMLRHNPAFRFLFDALDKGWLGRVFQVRGVISKKIPAGRRKELARFAGGGMYELGCHLVDAVVATLGDPTDVTAYNRRTYPEQDDFLDNQLAVFEYPRATASVRCAHVDPFGFQRRQFVVVGDAGSIEIRPLEPPELTLAIDRPRGDHEKGRRTVKLPEMPGRYDRQLAHFARAIRGEVDPAFGPDHDIATHQAVLAASGLPVE